MDDFSHETTINNHSWFSLFSPLNPHEVCISHCHVVQAHPVPVLPTLKRLGVQWPCDLNDTAAPTPWPDEKRVIVQAKKWQKPLEPIESINISGIWLIVIPRRKTEHDWTELFVLPSLIKLRMAGLGKAGNQRFHDADNHWDGVWGYPLRPKGTRLITTGSTSIFKPTCVQFFPDTPFLSGQRFQFLHCKVGFSQRVLLHHGRSCPLRCFWGIPMSHQELARSWNTSYRTTLYVITMQVNQANHQLKHQLVGKILCKCNTSQTWWWNIPPMPMML